MVAEKLEGALDELLAGDRPAALFEAMRYAVMPGGKRIRPKICFAAAVAVGGKMEDALYPACAVELMHSYTLVHDDLPAMDGDTVRRGRPSVWAKFDEATAILAGDSLQALAFVAASRAPRNVGKVVATLGEAGLGVVRGQQEELCSASGADIDFIYRHKTGDLFVAAAVMGAYAAGGSDADAGRLRGYAFNLGMAFQHRDDLLDGDSPCPVDDARRRVAEFTASAIASLNGLPGDASLLAALAGHLAERGE